MADTEKSSYSKRPPQFASWWRIVADDRCYWTMNRSDAEAAERRGAGVLEYVPVAAVTAALDEAHHD